MGTVIKSWERAGESGEEQGDSPRRTNLQERRDLGKRQLGGLEEERDRRPRGGGGEAVSTRSGLTGQAHLSNRGDEDAEVGHAQIWGRDRRW